MKNLKIIVSDVDGVLTDGTKCYDSSGRIFSKTYNDADILAIKKLKKIGIDFCLLSACSDVNESFARERGIDFRFVPRNSEGKRDKLSAYLEILKERNINPENAAYIGNDFVDIPTLKLASFSFCPSDCFDEVKNSSKIVCKTPGGKGVLYEVYEKVLHEIIQDLDIGKIRHNIDALRVFVYNVIENAGSGHPGMAIGSASVSYILFKHFLRFNPEDPGNEGRDRFVLSAGHASALLYSLLHLFGYKEPSIDDLLSFRKLGSKTPAHPERSLLQGVEITTGPLGQGFASSVGLAIASKHAQRSLEAPADQKIYCLVGDGCLMEGVSYEAASLAGRLKLNNLVAIYDCNSITIDGSVSLVSEEDISLRFKSAGWDVEVIEDGDYGILEMYFALERAKRATKPTILICKTTIGLGLPGVQGTEKAHGSPVTLDKAQMFREKLGFPLRTLEWQGTSDAFRSGRTLERFNLKASGKLDPEDACFSSFSISESISTRDANKAIIKILSNRIQGLVGGSADLSDSNGCFFSEKSFNVDASGKYIHFGVREHAMAAAINGIAIYSDYFKPFCATFACFSDYMKPSIRLASLSKIPSIFVLSHDSVDMGQDGPTHQPVEHATSYRALPGINVYRPSDTEELIGSWSCALSSDEPSIIFLGREKTNKTGNRSLVRLGGYAVMKSHDDKVAILSTGAEVDLSLAVAKEIKRKHGVGISVISVPCLEILEKNSDQLSSILPPSIKDVFAIEMLSGFEWHKHVRGCGCVIANNSFGHSSVWNDEYKRKMNFEISQIINIFETRLDLCK